MSNISLLSSQQVIASVDCDEDFAPPPLLFFEADGVTPIDLSGISFTSRIGNFPALTNAGGGGIQVAGNSLTFFVPAASKNWPSGRFSFSLLASDGTFTRDLFANSTLTVGGAASFAVTSWATNTAAVALSGLSGTALLATLMNMSAEQQQGVLIQLSDARAAYVPVLDFSHVVNSQYIGSTPFLFTVG
jgi:hypothetical protein